MSGLSFLCIFNACRAPEDEFCDPIDHSPRGRTRLEHLSNWFAGSASWRTAFFLEKCVLHGHTVEQTALEFSKMLSRHHKITTDQGQRQFKKRAGRSQRTEKQAQVRNRNQQCPHNPAGILRIPQEYDTAPLEYCIKNAVHKERQSGRIRTRTGDLLCVKQTF